MSLQFRVDPKTKSLVKVTESQVTAEELETELQAAADAAQNTLNEANANLTVKEAEHKAAEEALLDARQAVEDAEEAVAYSKSQRDELASSVQLLQELAESSPEEDNAVTPDEGIDIPVHPAEEVTA